MKVWHALGMRGVRRDGEKPVGGKPVTLHGRGLGAARVAVIAFAAVTLWLDLTNRLRAVRDTDGLWLAAIGDEENVRAALAVGGIALAAYLAKAAVALVTSGLHYGGALVLLRRRPRELIALLVAVFLIASAAPDFPPNLFALMGTEPIRATLGLIVTYCFPVPFVVLFYVFPDGRFTPRWTIIPAASWALLVAWDFFVARSIESPGPWADALTFGTLLASAVAAQIYRYRRVSGPIERQQTKWFVGGLGVALVTFMAGNILLSSVGALGADASGERVNTAWTIVEVAFGLSGFCVPVGLTIAVLKYRLFGIDIILNRALVYGGLTAAVIGLYVLIVGYLGALLRTGGNPAISLVATGVVAVLFQPLREWLQRGANRLLYGERDEPYAVISRLGRQLEGALTPDAILPAIVRTVAGALKLPYAAIALRPGDDAPIAAAVGSPTPAPLRLPLTYQGEAVGALLLAPRAPGEGFSRADRRLLDDLARQAGVAARAVRLALGHIQLGKLEPGQVQAMMNAKLASGLSPRTVQYLRAVLRRAIGQALKWGQVSRNVVILTDSPRVVRLEMQTLTPTQAHAFLDSVKGERLEGLYAVALAMGLRQGEALGLRWQDVDLDGGTLHVRVALQRVRGDQPRLVEPKTRQSRRSLPMPPAVTAQLRAHRTRQTEERLVAGPAWQGGPWGLVFCTATGGPLDARHVVYYFKRQLGRAGLPDIRFHDLRHSCASLLLAQNVHPRVVMEILGHSTITMTMNTYAHVLPEAQRQATALMDGLFGPAVANGT